MANLAGDCGPRSSCAIGAQLERGGRLCDRAPTNPYRARPLPAANNNDDNCVCITNERRAAVIAAAMRGQQVRAAAEPRATRSTVVMGRKRAASGESQQ